MAPPPAAGSAPGTVPFAVSADGSNDCLSNMRRVSQLPARFIVERPPTVVHRPSGRSCLLNSSGAWLVVSFFAAHAQDFKMPHESAAT